MHQICETVQHLESIQSMLVWCQEEKLELQKDH